VTVDDVFSRYCWLEALIKKEATQTTDALQKIINRAGIQPDTTILTDLGTEFEGTFADFCDQHRIVLIKTIPFSPKQNAVVEFCNRDVRKIINSFFSQNNNFIWYNILLDNKNSADNSQHLATK
jgi:glutathionylspermidine synthase